jgi:hypothetical protein
MKDDLEVEIRIILNPDTVIRQGNFISGHNKPKKEITDESC